MFTPIGNTLYEHGFSTAALITDGSVLVAGGQLAGGNGSSSAELYLAVTGMFAGIGNMTTGRHSHTATVLANGSVLITGGFQNWPSATARAEVYTPSKMRRIQLTSQ